MKNKIESSSSQFKISSQYIELINTVEITLKEILQLSKSSNDKRKQAQLAHLTNQFNKMKIALDTERSDHRFELDENQKKKLLEMKQLSNKEMNSLKKEFFRSILSKYKKRTQLIGVIDEKNNTVRPALMGKILKESENIARHPILKTHCEMKGGQLVNLARVANTIADALKILKDTIPTPYEVTNLSILQKRTIQVINKNILLKKKAIQLLEKKARQQEWLIYDGLVLKKNDKLFNKVLKYTYRRIDDNLSQLLIQFRNSHKNNGDLSPLYKEKNKIQLEVQEILNESGIRQSRQGDELTFKYSSQGNELLRGMLGLNDENTRTIHRIATSYFEMERALEQFVPLSPSPLNKKRPSSSKSYIPENLSESSDIPFSIVAEIQHSVDKNWNIFGDIYQINDLLHQYKDIQPDSGDALYQGNLINRHEKVSTLVENLQDILNNNNQLLQHPALDIQNNPYFTPGSGLKKEDPGYHIFNRKELLYLIKTAVFVREGFRVLKESQYADEEEMNRLAEIKLRKDAEDRKIIGGTARHLKALKEQIHNNFEFIENIEELFLESRRENEIKKWLSYDHIKSEYIADRKLFREMIKSFCSLSQNRLNQLEKGIANDNFKIAKASPAEKKEFLKKTMTRIIAVGKIQKPLAAILKEGGIDVTINRNSNSTELISFKHQQKGINLIQFNSKIIEKTLSNAQAVFIMLDAYRKKLFNTDQPSGQSEEEKGLQIDLELSNEFRDKINEISLLMKKALVEFKKMGKKVPKDLMELIKDRQRELGIVYKSFDPHTRKVINSIFEGPKEKLKKDNIKLGLQPKKDIMLDPKVQYIIHLAKIRGDGAFFKKLIESPKVAVDRVYLNYVEEKSLKQLLGTIYEVYSDYLRTKKNKGDFKQEQRIQKRLSVWMDDYFGHPAQWIQILFSELDTNKVKKIIKLYHTICDGRRIDRLRDITYGIIYHSITQNGLEIPDVKMFAPDIGAYEMEELVSKLITP